MGILDLLKPKPKTPPKPLEVLTTLERSVMGSTHKNSDGSDRQLIVQSCKAGDQIYMRPAPEKDYPDTIGIFTTSNKQIGILPPKDAKFINDKYPTSPRSVRVKGIRYYGDHWLCDIIITIFKPNAPEAPVQQSAVHFDSSKAVVLNDFHTKVVGVTFKNDNGTDRQTIIKNCKVGDDVVFRPAPSAKFPHAVAIFNSRGEQLGYVNDDLAKELTSKYPNNPMSVKIASLTGGDKDTLGCNLHIIIYKS